jgi:hypothetical protein
LPHQNTHATSGTRTCACRKMENSRPRPIRPRSRRVCCLAMCGVEATRARCLIHEDCGVWLLAYTVLSRTQGLWSPPPTPRPGPRASFAASTLASTFRLPPKSPPTTNRVARTCASTSCARRWPTTASTSCPAGLSAWSSSARGPALQPPQPDRPSPCRGHARRKGQAFTVPFPLHYLERSSPSNIPDRQGLPP